MHLNLETIHFWFIGDSGDLELMIMEADGNMTADFSNVMGRVLHESDTQVLIKAEGVPDITHYPEAMMVNHLEEDDEEDDED